MLPPSPVALVTDQVYQAVVGKTPTADQMRRVDAASAAVRRKAGWHIGPVITQQFDVDGPGGSTLFIPTGRLVNLVALSNAGTTVDVDPDTGTLDWSHDGWVEFRGAARWRGAGYGANCWTTRPRGIRVTIEHGYDEYADLVQLVVDVATRLIPNGVKATVNGASSVTYADPGFYGGELQTIQAFSISQVV